MNRAILVALGTGTIISSAAAIGIGAGLAPKATPLTRTQYQAAVVAAHVAEARRLDRCPATPATDRDLCRAKATATGLVQVADLDARFRRTPEAAREAQRARIDARYEVARARCMALRGRVQDQCFIEAHAAHGRALLESQAPYEIAR